MMQLSKEDYSATYFGADERFKDRAGYTEYKRYYINDGTEDNFSQRAKMLVDKFNLKGKRVLDVGCAYGFLVKSLRDLGVEAYGFDWSKFALSKKEEGNDYLIEGDAVNDLTQFPDNRFDLVTSWRFLSCVPEVSLPKIILEFNRISKNQLHMLDTKANEKYYNIKPVEYWSKFGWKSETILLNDSNRKEVVI